MPLRVLIVDDEPAIRELLAEYLRGRGLEATVAAHAEEGCALLGEEPFTAVVADLKLPGEDGLAVLRAARARDVPALLMTGFGTPESAVEAFNLGARGYLLKPFRLRDLFAQLDRAVADAERDRHLRWSAAAMELVTLATVADVPSLVEELVRRLEFLLAALPPTSDAGEPSTELHPLGGARSVAVPMRPEARALARVVGAAVTRLGA